MSRTTGLVIGVVILALVAAMAYFAVQRETGTTVVLVAVVLVAALAGAIAVSRKG
jgi:uncharacterized protein (UPF0333 family)